MAKALNLKTEWQTDRKAATISWNEQRLVTDDKVKMNLYVLAAGIAILVSLGIMISGNLIFGFIVFFGGFYLLFKGQGRETVSNILKITPDKITYDGVTFDIGRLTRVEYGRRSQWTGNSIAQGQADPTQIRIWIDDRQFHVVSTSMWETQIVHQIKLEIDDVIAELKKSTIKNEREETQGKTGEYGLPDY